MEIDWLLFIDQQQDHTKSAESYAIISLAHPTEKVIPNDLLLLQEQKKQERVNITLRENSTMKLES